MCGWGAVATKCNRSLHDFWGTEGIFGQYLFSYDTVFLFFVARLFTHATKMSYRKVSNGQDVDESLFGKPSGRRPRHNEGRRGGPSAPSTAMSRSALANLGASIAVGNIKDGLVVSRSDLNNFKDMTVIKTHDMVLKQRAARNKAREDRMKEAQKRKKRMRELEAEGKKHTVKSERK